MAGLEARVQDNWKTIHLGGIGGLEKWHPHSPCLVAKLLDDEAQGLSSQSKEDTLCCHVVSICSREISSPLFILAQ